MRRLRARVAATPEELADATAKQAFALCDTNRDGRLDYREFRGGTSPKTGNRILKWSRRRTPSRRCRTDYAA